MELEMFPGVKKTGGGLFQPGGCSDVGPGMRVPLVLELGGIYKL